MMYSPAGSGYGYSTGPQAPVTQMDRLNISASDPHGRSPGFTADYGRADNGYVPGSYGCVVLTVLHSLCYRFSSFDAM